MARKQGTKVPATTAAPPGAASHSTSGAGRIRQPAGHQLRAAAATTGSEEIASHELTFDLTVAIAYQAIREQFFARLNRTLTGLQVISGTSAIAALSDMIWVGPTALLVITAVTGVVSLVIDPAGAARDHHALRSRLHNIRAELEELGMTAARMRAARAGMARVAADSPPAYRGVQAIAYNAAVNAIYDESEAARYRFRISWLRRLIAQWAPMRGFVFKR